VAKIMKFGYQMRLGWFFLAFNGDQPKQFLIDQNIAKQTAADVLSETNRDWKFPGVTFWLAPPSDVGKN
jgi:hypothetical protein